MRKILMAILMLLLVSASLFSCKSKNAEQMPPPTENVRTPFELSGLEVIRPRKGVSTLLLAAGKEIVTAVGEYAGFTISQRDDSNAVKTKEILIGNTTRAESAEAAALLPKEQFAFVIRRTGNKLAIVGTSNEMTAQGVLYFVNNVLPERLGADGKLLLEENYCYVHTIGGVSFLNSNNTYRIVIADETADITQSYADSIRTDLLNLTKRTVILQKDTADKDAERDSTLKEILVGGTYYPESVAFMNESQFSQYGVAVEGNKLIIFGYSATAIKKAAELFGDLLESCQTQDGQLLIPNELKLIFSDQTIGLPPIPAYPTFSVTTRKVTGNATEVTVSSGDREVFISYAKGLAEKGYTLLSETSVGDNLFYVYQNRRYALTLAYDPTAAEISITVDASTGAPIRETDCEEICEPLLTQMALSHLQVNAGMGYIIRLSDGRFIVIDGGADDGLDYIKMYNILKSQCVNGEVPVIAAWILTHGHDDHYGNFLKMMSVYVPNGEIVLQNVIQNLPSGGAGGLSDGAILSGVSTAPGVRILYARTGQSHVVGGAQIDILYTPDDFYPDAIKGGNNTSVVFRVTLGGQTIMFLGDCENQEATHVYKRYGDALKCDIMQQAHHGYWAGSVKLYQAIDPEVVLWPSPAHWYYDLYDGTWGNSSNKWITMQSENVRQIILAAAGTRTLTMPHTAVFEKPHLISNTYDAGTVLYHEDFEDITYVFETGYWCVDTNDYNVGLNNGVSYSGVNLTIKEENGNRGLTLTGSTYSVMGMIRPEQIRGNNVFTVELDLTLSSVDKGLWIWFNDLRPVNIQNRSMVQLTVNGSQRISLEVDLDAGTYRLYRNGVLFEEGVNDSNDMGFICMHSQGGQAFIKEVTVWAGRFEDRK